MIYDLNYLPNMRFSLSHWSIFVCRFVVLLFCVYLSNLRCNYFVPVFRRVSQIREKRLLVSSYLFVWPHETTRLPTGVFSWNYGSEYFFKTLCRKFKLHFNRSIIMGISYEDQYTFLIMPRWNLLRMRNVSDKYRRQNQNTFYVQ